MKNWTLPADESIMPKNVYVLLRVFDIDDDPMVRAYLDPWARSQEGQLDFAATQWVVISRR